MKDYVLEILFDTADAAIEEQIQSRLFLSATTGSISDELGVYAYFESAGQRDAAAATFRDLAGVITRDQDREHVDWLERYEQSLQPLFIGRRFVVAPDSSLLPRNSGRLELVVPQEQAFGTGAHETTSLCIELLEEGPLQGARGLDVGSGSGILAMAMLRLGAQKVLAFDNDTDTYGALRDNRRRNGIDESRMPVFIGGPEAIRAGRFDVVTMNILPDVVMPMLTPVASHLGPEGRVIVSGILLTRAAEVVAYARSHSLELANERQKGEWWAGELRLA